MKVRLNIGNKMMKNVLSASLKGCYTFIILAFLISLTNVAFAQDRTKSKSTTIKAGEQKGTTTIKIMDAGMDTKQFATVTIPNDSCVWIGKLVQGNPMAPPSRLPACWATANVVLGADGNLAIGSTPQATGLLFNFAAGIGTPTLIGYTPFQAGGTTTGWNANKIKFIYPPQAFPTTWQNSAGTHFTNTLVSAAPTGNNEMRMTSDWNTGIDPCSLIPGGKWRMPTRSEMNALIAVTTNDISDVGAEVVNAQFTVGYVDGTSDNDLTTKGRWFNGTSTRTANTGIFLPQVSYMLEANGNYQNGDGEYKTSTQLFAGTGSGISFNKSSALRSSHHSGSGYPMPIRCVRDFKTEEGCFQVNTKGTDMEPACWAYGNVTLDPATCELAIASTPYEAGLFFQYGGGKAKTLIGYSLPKTGTAFTAAQIQYTSSGTATGITFPGRGSANDYNSATQTVFWNNGIDPCSLIPGGLWRLPTANEYKALFGEALKNTTKTVTGEYVITNETANLPTSTGNGIWLNGTTDKRKKGGGVFFPFVGLLSPGGGVMTPNSQNSYWANYSVSPTANGLWIPFGTTTTVSIGTQDSGYKDEARPVRCVRNTNPSTITNDKVTNPGSDGNFAGGGGNVTGGGTGSSSDGSLSDAELKPESDTPNSGLEIPLDKEVPGSDLTLPSSRKPAVWATANVTLGEDGNLKIGDSPYETGLYFHWAGGLRYPTIVGYSAPTNAPTVTKWTKDQIKYVSPGGTAPTVWPETEGTYNSYGTQVNSNPVGYTASRMTSDWNSGIDPCSLIPGGQWRLPTRAEASALMAIPFNDIEGGIYDNSDGVVTGSYNYKKTTSGRWLNGTTTRKVGDGIFLPFVGMLTFKGSFLILSRGEIGAYITSTEYSDLYAFTLSVFNTEIRTDYRSKSEAFVARCVRVNNGQDDFEVNYETPGSSGAPSSRVPAVWAKGNVDIGADGKLKIADNPQKRGLYFQWAGGIENPTIIGYSAPETGTAWSKAQIKYMSPGGVGINSWSDLKVGVHYSNTQVNPLPTGNTTLRMTADWNSGKDPCTLIQGGLWRLPTRAEMNALVASTSNDITTNGQESAPTGEVLKGSVLGAYLGNDMVSVGIWLNGTKDRVVGEGVFLPAAGFINQNGGDFSYRDTHGLYVTSTELAPTNVAGLFFNIKVVNGSTSGGFISPGWNTGKKEAASVRCVKSESSSVNECYQVNTFVPGSNSTTPASRQPACWAYSNLDLGPTVGGNPTLKIGAEPTTTGLYFQWAGGLENPIIIGYSQPMSGTAFNVANIKYWNGTKPTAWTTTGGTYFNTSLINPDPNKGQTALRMNSDWNGTSDPCRLVPGGKWRLPTRAEMNALMASKGNDITDFGSETSSAGWVDGTSNYKYTTAGRWFNGTSDRKVYSGIFLPAAGYLQKNAGVLTGNGTYGAYKTSTEYDASSYALLYFNSTVLQPAGSVSPGHEGDNIRCVKNATTSLVETAKKASDECFQVSGFTQGEYDSQKNITYPNSNMPACWAPANVVAKDGALTIGEDPTETGLFFQWAGGIGAGTIVGYQKPLGTSTAWAASTIKYSSGTNPTAWQKTGGTYNGYKIAVSTVTDSLTVPARMLSDWTYSPCSLIPGGLWRLPTRAEMNALIASTTDDITGTGKETTSVGYQAGTGGLTNAIITTKGWWFNGKPVKSVSDGIFLPFTGYYNHAGTFDNTKSLYWTSTSASPSRAFALAVDATSYEPSSMQYKTFGAQVRCVRETRRTEECFYVGNSIVGTDPNQPSSRKPACWAYANIDVSPSGQLKIADSPYSIGAKFQWAGGLSNPIIVGYENQSFTAASSVKFIHPAGATKPGAFPGAGGAYNKQNSYSNELTAVANPSQKMLSDWNIYDPCTLIPSGLWRMPTLAEYNALIASETLTCLDNCGTDATKHKGYVAGAYNADTKTNREGIWMDGTSTTQIGNGIFMPRSYAVTGGGLVTAVKASHYWTSTDGGTMFAYSFYLDEGAKTAAIGKDRYKTDANSIRCVRKDSELPVFKTENYVTLGENVTVGGNQVRARANWAKGNVTIGKDGGLAIAESPFEAGLLFQYAGGLAKPVIVGYDRPRDIDFEQISARHVKYVNGGTPPTGLVKTGGKYNSKGTAPAITGYGANNMSSSWGVANDPCQLVKGGEWRLPTRAEMLSLIAPLNDNGGIANDASNTEILSSPGTADYRGTLSSEYSVYKTNGIWVSGVRKSGAGTGRLIDNRIFLPHVGYLGEDGYLAPLQTYYMTSTANDANNNFALGYNSSNSTVTYSASVSKAIAQSVRCVLKAPVTDIDVKFTLKTGNATFNATTSTVKAEYTATSFDLTAEVGSTFGAIAASDNWITLSGAGTNVKTATLSQNGSSTKRVGKITITNGSKTRYIIVSQAPVQLINSITSKTDNPKLVYDVDNNLINVPGEGDTAKVILAPGTTITTVAADTWVKSTLKSGNEYEWAFEKNAGTTTRTSKITLKNGSSPAVDFTISQEKYNVNPVTSIAFSSAALGFSIDAPTATIEQSSGKSGYIIFTVVEGSTISISEAAKYWLSSTTKNPTTLHLELTENIGDLRSADIKVINASNEGAYKIVQRMSTVDNIVTKVTPGTGVTQVGSTKEYKLNGDVSSNITFELVGGTEVDITQGADWLTPVKKSDNPLTYEVGIATNETGVNRGGEITISRGTGTSKKVEVYTITQPLYKPTIPKGDRIIIGYLASYADPNGELLQDLKNKQTVTHVLLSFAKPDMTYTAGSKDISKSKTGLEFGPGFTFDKLKTIVTELKAAGIKVILSLGGETYWQPGGGTETELITMYSNIKYDDIATFVKELGLSGIDWDYEPLGKFDVTGQGAHKIAYVKMIQEMRKKLPKSEGYLIVTAPSGVGALGGVTAGYNDATSPYKYENRIALSGEAGDTEPSATDNSNPSTRSAFNFVSTGSMIPVFNSLANGDLDIVAFQGYNVGTMPKRELMYDSYAYYAEKLGFKVAFGMHYRSEPWGPYHTYQHADVEKYAKYVLEGGKDGLRKGKKDGVMFWDITTGKDKGEIDGLDFAEICNYVFDGKAVPNVPKGTVLTPGKDAHYRNNSDIVVTNTFRNADEVVVTFNSKEYRNIRSPFTITIPKADLFSDSYIQSKGGGYVTAPIQVKAIKYGNPQQVLGPIEHTLYITESNYGQDGANLVNFWESGKEYPAKDLYVVWKGFIWKSEWYMGAGLEPGVENRNDTSQPEASRCVYEDTSVGLYNCGWRKAKAL